MLFNLSQLYNLSRRNREATPGFISALGTPTISPGLFCRLAVWVRCQLNNPESKTTTITVTKTTLIT